MKRDREPKPKMTMDRAARRYGQVREIEAQITALELDISKAIQAARDAGATVKELRKARETRLADLRGFARDEGQLPLLPFVGEDEDTGEAPPAAPPS